MFYPRMTAELLGGGDGSIFTSGEIKPCEYFLRGATRECGFSMTTSRVKKNKKCGYF